MLWHVSTLWCCAGMHPRPAVLSPGSCQMSGKTGSKCNETCSRSCTTAKQYMQMLY